MGFNILTGNLGQGWGVVLIVCLAICQRPFSHLTLCYIKSLLWQNPFLTLLFLTVPMPEVCSWLPTWLLASSAEGSHLPSLWRDWEEDGPSLS